MDDAPKAEPEDSPYIRLPWPLVAAGLLGLLAVALAVGLFANRYLRPQLDVLPTTTPLVIAAVAPTRVPEPTPVPTATAGPAITATPALTAAPTPAPTLAPAATPPALATRPTATAPPPTPALAPSPAATPRATVSPELATEIGDAYQEYWQVRAEALYDLDVSHLPTVMAGDHLAAAEELIGQLRSEGRAIQTEVDHHYAIVRATADEADVADEYTDDSVYVDMNSHQTLTQPLAGGVKEQYRMNKIEGTWRVVSLVRAP